MFSADDAREFREESENAALSRLLSALRPEQVAQPDLRFKWALKFDEFPGGSIRPVQVKVEELDRNAGPAPKAPDFKSVCRPIPPSVDLTFPEFELLAMPAEEA